MSSAGTLNRTLSREKFSILNQFKTFSHEIANDYHRALHRDNEILKARGLSPKNHHSEQSLLMMQQKEILTSRNQQRKSLFNTVNMASRGRRRDSKMSKQSRSSPRPPRSDASPLQDFPRSPAKGGSSTAKKPKQVKISEQPTITVSESQTPALPEAKPSL